MLSEPEQRWDMSLGGTFIYCDAGAAAAIPATVRGFWRRRFKPLAPKVCEVIYQVRDATRGARATLIYSPHNVQ